MERNILAVGDVVAPAGVKYCKAALPRLRRELAVDFCVVIGENAAVLGMLPAQAEELLSAGADVITLGNHTWNRLQIGDYLDKEERILRPANYAGRVPGRGMGIYPCKGLRIAVLNLMGRAELNSNLDNPFKMANTLLRGGDFDLALLDFHAEATSEKGAMGWFLDGKVQAVWGTHTHVPTADERVCPRGTGYITDLGMTGSIESVLGIAPRQSVEGLLGGLPGRYRAPEGPAKLQGAIFTLDSATGLCTAVERIDVR